VSDRLYHEALMEAARDAEGRGRLAQADATAVVDNPLCGDRVTVDVKLDGGRIAAIGHEVKGCILCQASASILGRKALGLDRAGVAASTEAMESLLAGEAPSREPGFEPFRPVAAYRSRHDCVLLPFRALERALGDS
jgi:nitrogen fixation NifU-like protein